MVIDLIEVPSKMKKLNGGLDNGYTEVTFQLSDKMIEKIAGISRVYRGETYRSIFIAKNKVE